MLFFRFFHFQNLKNSADLIIFNLFLLCLTWEFKYILNLGAAGGFHASPSVAFFLLIQAQPNLVWSQSLLKRSNFDFFENIRDCSLFIGSTGPVFCGKDPWKMFLSRQQKSPKKLVSRQWKEGKVHVPYNYTILTLCWRHNMQ